MITLPAILSSNTRAVVPIDGRSYTFVFRWNARDSSWYFDVIDDDQRLVCTGVRVVLGAYLGRRVPHALFRDGVLVALDTSGQGREATIEDLGSRVLLRYYGVVEASLLRAGATVVQGPS